MSYVRQEKSARPIRQNTAENRSLVVHLSSTCAATETLSVCTRSTTFGMTTPRIHGMLAARISGSLTLSQRLQVNVSIPVFASAFEL